MPRDLSGMDQDRHLLIFCPCARGGIADYAHEHATAISDLGIAITMLCPLDFCHPAGNYAQERRLSIAPELRRTRFESRIRFVLRLLRDTRILDRTLFRTGSNRVLFASYTEYLAPLWAWRFRRHQKRGVVFGAIAHDPVRDYRVGPRWWHRRSIRSAYSFLREVFVHEAISLETLGEFPILRTSVIPHGVFRFPPPSTTRMEMRSRLEIPDSSYLFLSFGHIRNNKNIPLVLRALVDVPSAWLLVAGPEATVGQTSSDSLRDLALELGVADRCRWLVNYLDPDQVSNCFNTSDAVLLTYSSTFRSASGVLNVAGWFRKPVLVSGGESNLRTSVLAYHLGPAVPPDSSDSIASGMAELMQTSFTSGWDHYLAENNWERNARVVVETLFE